MAPNKMKGKPRITQTTEYKHALATAIAKFLEFPPAKVHRITFEDMRARGNPGPGWAREGVK